MEFVSKTGVTISINRIEVRIKVPGLRYAKSVPTTDIGWLLGEGYCRIFYEAEELVYEGEDSKELCLCLARAVSGDSYVVNESNEQFKQTRGKRSPRKERQHLLPSFRARLDSWVGHYDIVDQVTEAYLKDSLVPIVLLHGAQKYPFYSWRNLPLDEAKDKYQDAFWRHYLPEIFYPDDGPEWKDKETGMHHWAHAAACMFILKDLKTQLEIDEEFLETMSERVKL